MFNLTRYFLTLSSVLMLLAGSILGSYYQQQALHQLTTQAEEHNVAMAEMLRNALRPRLNALLAPASGKELREFSGTVGDLMHGTAVVKVKIYDVNGLTVFSSDPTQIGEDKRDNPGFRSALGERVISDLIHRDQFDTFEGSKTDIDLVASYIPIRIDDRIGGVFEL